MWSRTVEFMLGCWLAMSPFIFNHPPGEAHLWWTDLGGAAAICFLSAISFIRSTKRAHLLLIPIGGWLIASGYLFGGHPVEPALQNHVIAGLLLLMFAVIPSESSRPPKGWREREPQADWAFSEE